MPYVADGALLNNQCPSLFTFLWLREFASVFAPPPPLRSAPASVPVFVSFVLRFSLLCFVFTIGGFVLSDLFPHALLSLFGWLGWAAV